MAVETSAQALIRISAQACAGPEGIMEQEQENLTALGPTHRAATLVATAWKCAPLKDPLWPVFKSSNIHRI